MMLACPIVHVWFDQLLDEGGVRSRLPISSPMIARVAQRIRAGSSYLLAVRSSHLPWLTSASARPRGARRVISADVVSSSGSHIKRHG